GFRRFDPRHRAGTAGTRRIAIVGPDRHRAPRLERRPPLHLLGLPQLAFAKDNGMRIDLILGNPAFTEAVQDAYVDRNARQDSPAGPPSDHAPVVVDLAFPS